MKNTLTALLMFPVGVALLGSQLLIGAALLKLSILVLFGGAL